MFRRQRLKKVHGEFLKSCRNLKEGRDFWGQASGVRNWLLELLTPIPLMGLHEEGRHLLTALEWLERNCIDRPLGEQVMREYHRIVYRGDEKQAGEYRRHEIVMEQSAIRRRPFQKVVPAMKALDARLAREQKELDGQSIPDRDRVVRSAVEIHHQIGFIHPFADANGRVARLSMNHFLRRYVRGYVIYPPLSESKELWDALQVADHGDIQPLIRCAQSHFFRL